MKTINHRRARRDLQAQLSGALPEADAACLRSHLQGCPDCRHYAAEMAGLDADLRREARLQRNAGPTYSPQTAGAIYERLANRRARMKRNWLSSLGGAAALGLLLILIGGGISLLVSQGVIPTGQRAEGTVTAAPVLAAPSPTAEPGETAPPTTETGRENSAGPRFTEEHPLTSQTEIIALLEKLGDKELKRLRSTNWVHIQEENSSFNRSTATTREKWIQPFPEDGPCSNWMTEVREIHGERKYIQHLVSLSDGTYGDLVELGSGKGEVYRTGPDCKMNRAGTQAGLLAMRIAAKASISNSNILKEVRAWYPSGDDQAFLRIYTRFEGTSDRIPVWEETFTFDLQSGLLIERLVQQSWKSGDEIYSDPENRQTFEYEFLETLDDDTAARLTSAAAKLQSYAIHSWTYSQEDPLTALPQIIALLEELGDKNLEAFLGANWVHTTYRTEYSPTIPMSTPPFVGESWMQYSPEAGPCPRGLDESGQDMDGENPLANRIVYLADGTVANLLLQEDGTVNAGQRGGGCVLTRDDTRAGILASVLRGERSVQGRGQFTLSEARAWMQPVDGVMAWVVYLRHEKTTSSTPPLLQETYTFDLESGLLLSLVREEGFKDGRVIFQTWETLQYQILDELDPEVLAKIEAAEAELRGARTP